MRDLCDVSFDLNVFVFIRTSDPFDCLIAVLCFFFY